MSKRIFGARTNLILASIAVSLLTALTAVLLKNGVHLIRSVVQFVSIRQNLQWLLFFFPMTGILLTVIYSQVFLKGRLGRGITNVIYCISRKSSYVEKDKLYSQIITSVLTVGFGGSAGLEAPIASTGSAIGSNLAKWLRFSAKERTLLLACGAAAGISAIFNAPIAGVIFAFEILLVDMPMPVVVPLLIASATASLFSRLIYSGQPFVLITDTWQSSHFLFYVLLGFISAGVSVYAIRIYFKLGELFSGQKRIYIKSIAGGILLGGLIYFFPALYGEGYESVLDLLHRNPMAILEDNILVNHIGIWTLILFSTAYMLLKVVATSITVGSGGNGGMFGSSLFTGAMCGYAFSHTINILGLANLNEVNFTVIGMAAAMSGIIHAPLTAIFLIAEITGGYALFVPLMIASSISFLVSRYFEPYSVYTKKLALKGDIINTNKDKYLLGRMHIRNYLEKEFVPVKQYDTLAQLVKAISTSNRNIFPVIDDKNMLVGIVSLDDVRNIMFTDELYDKVLVNDVMKNPPAIIDIHEDMEAVLKKLDINNVWNLPVTDQGVYVGYVSKSKILSNYRDNLVKEADLPA